MLFISQPVTSPHSVPLTGAPSPRNLIVQVLCETPRGSLIWFLLNLISMFFQLSALGWGGAQWVKYLQKVQAKRSEFGSPAPT